MNTAYKKLTITLPSKLHKEYRQLLENIGISLSKRLSILVEEDIDILREVKQITKKSAKK